MKTYRIEDIQKVLYNGKKCKMFKAYELIGNDFIFRGNFTAPLRVKNAFLHNTIAYDGPVNRWELAK
jgi:hypothetical protein